VKGARSLTSGMLVLAAICAVPAVSAAQDKRHARRHHRRRPRPRRTPPPRLPTQAMLARRTLRRRAGVRRREIRARPPPASGEMSTQRPVALRRTPGRRPTRVSIGERRHGRLLLPPGSVTVSVGDTVTWATTPGQAPHTATATTAASTPGHDSNAGGSRLPRPFNSAGTFSYICTIHPNMRGTVRVLSRQRGRRQFRLELQRLRDLRGFRGLLPNAAGLPPRCR